MRALDAVAGWPEPDHAAAAGVVGSRGERTLERAQVGDGSTPFAWASVTKLLVAMAVLVAVEEGVMGLDDPAGPPGATVRHLLAHASGLAPDGPGVLAVPGRRRIYSNSGYDIVAELLGEQARMTFADYLAGAVLGPLGMTGTNLVPGASPASGATGTLDDLMALGAELLAPSVIDAATLALATTVAFPGLAGVLPGYGRFDPCDWGLGFEIKGAKAPHWTGTRNSPSAFGHFGRSGSLLWVDPAEGLALAVLSGRDFGPWAVTAWPELADSVIDEWRSEATGGGAAPRRPSPSMA
ncbi:MAG: serine hydrolase domain-containing protein [Acidimicrobiales bacterium]